MNFTTQKMKFSIKDFSSKCDQIRRKLHFLCSVLTFLPEYFQIIIKGTSQENILAKTLLDLQGSMRDMAFAVLFHLPKTSLRGAFMAISNVYDGPFLLK